MKITGIIAEYNPLHTGHAYHLRAARECSGSDYVIAVMSPDFVQRAEPAVFDKYVRTKMALQNGADLVLELPVCYATASAEYFALGAAALLEGLHAVDTLCFGCETPDAPLLWKTASFLQQETEEYRRLLKQHLKAGITFPQARAMALSTCFEEEGEALSRLLSSPNNILALEYCRALIRLSSSMDILPVARSVDYHSASLSGTYCSAFALREALSGLSQDVSPKVKEILDYIPQDCQDSFLEASRYRMDREDFLPCLTQKLLAGEELSSVFDLTPPLADRIERLRFTCMGKSWEQITALLKTRSFTEARIRRILLHLLLGIREDSVQKFLLEGPVCYARVLGFRRQASPLLHHLSKSSSLPLLTKPSRAEQMLNDTGREMLALDFYASHLYGSIRAIKYGTPFLTEYQRSPIIL